MKIPKNIEIKIVNINSQNKKDKLLKAINQLSKVLNIPATIKPVEKTKEEPFPFIAQDELFTNIMMYIGLFMDELYSRVCSTLGLRPVNTFSKSINPDAPKLLPGEILWNPETRRPITQKELDKMLIAIDKFLTKNNPGQKIVLSNTAIARIIADMRKNSEYSDMRLKQLKDIRYKKDLWSSFDFQKLVTEFGIDKERLKFRERVVANHIADINDQIKSSIRNIVDDGYLSGKMKGEISQELFDKFGSLNKNWKRIVDTESVNIFNTEYMEEQRKKDTGAVYYIRREFNDDKTCKFCSKANNDSIIARWSDVPLTDENIDDPVAKIAVWDGKSNVGRDRKDWWWAQGGQHPNCYSDDTEVLTDQGWKFFKDVLITDKIMSINPETREVDFLNHKGLISYHYEGNMIHFDGLNYDKLVTPDHNCLYAAKKGRGKSLLQAKAKDLMGKDVALPRAVAQWTGDSSELERQAVIAGLDPITYSKLWGWFLSEGNVRYSSRRSEIKLSQKYTEKIIKDIGENNLFKECKEAVYVSNRRVVALFADYCGVHAEKKYIPSFIKNAKKEHIEAFINSFLLGDGSQRLSESSNPKFGKSLEKVIRTSSPKMMADLVELIIKTGLFCSVHKQEQKGVAVKHKNGTYITKTDCYNINITKSKYRYYHKEPKLSSVTGTYSKEIKELPYSGMVHDVELEKWHFLLVKRNGKLAWSGNCRGHWDRYFPEIGDLKF